MGNGSSTSLGAARVVLEAAAVPALVILGVMLNAESTARKTAEARDRVEAAELARTNQSLDSLVKARRRIDTLWRHDSIPYAKVMNHYDSVTVHDTAWKHDTVAVLADSVIHACRAVLSDCEQQRAIDARIIQGLAQDTASWRIRWQAAQQQRPSVFSTVGKIVIAGLVGYSLRAITVR